MSEHLEALILGIVQGLTEFLPVSSSGHLELAKWLLGDENTANESFMMTVVLHFGTALATLWVFRSYILNILKNIIRPEGRRFVWFIILSMIPAGLVGLLLEEQISALFDRKIILVAVCLCVTGLILLFSDRVKNSGKHITPLLSFLIGISQAIAILPGISRSGATISSGIALGIERKEVARFSFLMVIPLILAKIGKDFISGEMTSHATQFVPLAIGFVSSFVVGILACRWMVSAVQQAKLRYFGYYCLAVGILAIVLRLTLLKA